MFQKPFRLLAVYFFLFSASAQARSAYASLFYAVEVSNTQTDLEPLKISIDKVLEIEAQIERHTLNSFELRELKYLLAHWRDLTTRKLVLLTKAADTQAVISAFDLIERVKGRLTPWEADVIAEAGQRTDKTKAAFLLADYADRGHAKGLIQDLGIPQALPRLGGPGIHSIVPYKATKSLGDLMWVDAKNLQDMAPIRSIEELSEFEFLSDHSIRYHGAELRTGDVLGFDLALEADGVMGSLAVTPAALNHVGMFVIFHREGRRVPAVLKFSSTGPRVVPLPNFFNSEITYERPRTKDSSEIPPLKETGRHTFHVEAYRFRDSVTDDWYAEVEKSVITVLGAGYQNDFRCRPLNADGSSYASPTGARSIICTTMVEHIYRATGKNVHFLRTPYDERAQPNLEALDLGTEKDLALPVSIALSPGFRHVATFDTGSYITNLARELFMGDPNGLGSAGYALTHKRFDLRKLPETGKTDRLRQLFRTGAHPNLDLDKVNPIPAETAFFFLKALELLPKPVQSLVPDCLQRIVELGNRPLHFSWVQNDPNLVDALHRVFQEAGIPGWYVE
ncbi:hypothetical protein K2X33_04210 [bacterium]|nr:hypothetical protein [bacterium]